MSKESEVIAETRVVLYNIHSKLLKLGESINSKKSIIESTGLMRDIQKDVTRALHNMSKRPLDDMEDRKVILNWLKYVSEILNGLNKTALNQQKWM